MIDPGATASDSSLAATLNVFPGQQLNAVMSGHKKGLAVPDHYRLGPGEGIIMFFVWHSDNLSTVKKGRVFLRSALRPGLYSPSAGLLPAHGPGIHRERPIPGVGSNRRAGGAAFQGPDSYHLSKRGRRGQPSFNRAPPTSAVPPGTGMTA